MEQYIVSVYRADVSRASTPHQRGQQELATDLLLVKMYLPSFSNVYHSSQYILLLFISYIRTIQI